MQTAPILNFLQNLQNHNDREWFNANKEQYNQAYAEFSALVSYWIYKVSQNDTEISGLQPKDCIFRIYRDTRFSKDKAPYKLNFGAALSKQTKSSSEFASYYVHIQPNGETFVGGGIYMPPTEVLTKIRQEVDYNTDKFKQIIQNPDFVRFFPELQGEKLKTAPKGYPKDHPEIELLKLKSFVVGRKFSDEKVLEESFKEEVANCFLVMKDFIHFLNTAVE